jgi:D-3-phosphoglycerate dehydrogenase
VLGLAGFGRIGRALARKAQAFGLEILAYDPYLPPSAAEEAQVELVDLDTLLARSDFISIHAPLTPETRHLFNASAFDKMKRGAFLINTSRGGLVDEVALGQALEAGKLGDAALDVLGTEPPAADSPLLQRDNVILTPHMAYYSEESTADLQRKAAEEVVRVLQGSAPRYPANPSVGIVYARGVLT